MTKTCGKCGHAALDDQALFCNRCGAAVPEERKPAFPVCQGCGTVVSDELAQFCNRCGAGIPAVPAVCSSCGSPAIDDQSRFCTRCGATFELHPAPRTISCPSCGAPDTQGQSLFCNRCGAPFNRPSVQGANHPNQAPVIITQRKPAGHIPPVMVPDSDWEPWNDVVDPILPGSPTPSLPEQPAYHDQKIALPPKRYAHLPLIAEDMKKKSDPSVRLQAPNSPDMLQKKKTGPKKGVLGFLKK